MRAEMLAVGRIFSSLRAEVNEIFSPKHLCLLKCLLRTLGNVSIRLLFSDTYLTVLSPELFKYKKQLFLS